MKTGLPSLFSVKLFASALLLFCIVPGSSVRVASIHDLHSAGQGALGSLLEFDTSAKDR